MRKIVPLFLSNSFEFYQLRVEPIFKSLLICNWPTWSRASPLLPESPNMEGFCSVLNLLQKADANKLSHSIFPPTIWIFNLNIYVKVIFLQKSWFWLLHMMNTSKVLIFSQLKRSLNAIKIQRMRFIDIENFFCCKSATLQSNRKRKLFFEQKHRHF